MSNSEINIVVHDPVPQSSIGFKVNAGDLYSCPQINIDGGKADAVYSQSLIINGGKALWQR